MIKFLLGVAIVAFTSFCGYLLSKKYRRRKSFFYQLYEFNERFLSEIAYARRPLKEFAAEYAYQGEFNELLQDFFTTMDDRVPFTAVFNETPAYAFLTQEEKRTVEDYFLMLGRGDSTSQKNYFSTVKTSLCRYKDEAENQSKKYGDLYVKIGFLCGLLILILIV